MPVGRGFLPNRRPLLPNARRGQGGVTPAGGLRPDGATSGGDRGAVRRSARACHRLPRTGFAPRCGRGARAVTGAAAGRTPRIRPAPAIACGASDSPRTPRPWRRGRGRGRVMAASRGRRRSPPCAGPARDGCAHRSGRQRGGESAPTRAPRALAPGRLRPPAAGYLPDLVAEAVWRQRRGPGAALAGLLLPSVPCCALPRTAPRARASATAFSSTGSCGRPLAAPPGPG